MVHRRAVSYGSGRVVGIGKSCSGVDGWLGRAVSGTGCVVSAPEGRVGAPRLPQAAGKAAAVTINRQATNFRGVID